jgi:hypothetical protein
VVATAGSRRLAHWIVFGLAGGPFPALARCAADTVFRSTTRLESFDTLRTSGPTEKSAQQRIEE